MPTKKAIKKRAVVVNVGGEILKIIAPMTTDDFKTAEELLIEMGRPVSSSSRHALLDKMKPFILAGQIQCERVRRQRVDKVWHMVAAYRMVKTKRK